MDDLSAIIASLNQVDYFLQRRPSSTREMGFLPDDPAYGRETRALEQLQSELSLAIKKLQHRRDNNNPQLVQARAVARKLEREMKASIERADHVNVHELLAAGSEKIHEYHDAREQTFQLRELTGTPQSYGYHNASELQPSMANSAEAFGPFFDHLRLRPTAKPPERLGRIEPSAPGDRVADP